MAVKPPIVVIDEISFAVEQFKVGHLIFALGVSYVVKSEETI